MTTAPRPRSRALDVVVWASTALAVGSALLAIGHLGVQVPLLSALGPGGPGVVVPAAIAFTVGACLHGAVAIGVAKRRPWAWIMGMLVGTLTLIGATTPFRGAVSLLGILLAGLQVGLLATGGARRRILRSARA